MKDWSLIEWLIAVAVVLIIAAAVFLAFNNHHYMQDGQAIKVVGGCEYISTGSIEHESLTHKANCTNHIHSWNQ